MPSSSQELVISLSVPIETDMEIAAYRNHLLAIVALGICSLEMDDY